MREIRSVRGVEKEVHAEIPKGELKKPISPLEKYEAKMEKVEKRTDYLIEKSKKHTLNSAQVKNKSPQINTHQEHFGRSAKEANLIEFYCLKGLPKIILGHIQSKMYFEAQLQQWISVIDTEDLKLVSGRTASHLSVQILRLEKQGWFQLLKSSNAGVRVFQINPEAFPVQ